MFLKLRRLENDVIIQIIGILQIPGTTVSVRSILSA